MTTVSRFSRQNDAGLRALNVVLWENLVHVVVLVLESKGPYYVSSGLKVARHSRHVYWFKFERRPHIQSREQLSCRRLSALI